MRPCNNNKYLTLKPLHSMFGKIFIDNNKKRGLKDSKRDARMVKKGLILILMFGSLLLPSDALMSWNFERYTSMNDIIILDNDV